jgi:hypothetical protein
MPSVRVLPDYRCPICGTVFRPLWRGSRYCSTGCAAQATGQLHAVRAVTADARAIAYYTGAADRRYGRPSRVTADALGLIAERYRAGYQAVTPR